MSVLSERCVLSVVCDVEPLLPDGACPGLGVESEILLAIFVRSETRARCTFAEDGEDLQAPSSNVLESPAGRQAGAHMRVCRRIE